MKSWSQTSVLLSVTWTFRTHVSWQSDVDHFVECTSCPCFFSFQLFKLSFWSQNSWCEVLNIPYLDMWPIFAKPSERLSELSSNSFYPIHKIKIFCFQRLFTKPLSTRRKNHKKNLNTKKYKKILFSF